MIELRYRTVPADWEELVVTATRRAMGVNGWFRQQLLGFAIGLPIGLSAGLLHACFSPEWDGKSFALGAAIFWLIQYALNTWRLRALSTKAIKSSGTSIGDRELIADQSGVSLRGPICQSTTQWAAFDEITTQARTLVLWTEPADGVIIPRSAFATPAAEKKFVDFVKARIAPANMANGTAGPSSW